MSEDPAQKQTDATPTSGDIRGPLIKIALILGCVGIGALVYRWKTREPPLPKALPTVVAATTRSVELRGVQWLAPDRRANPFTLADVRAPRVWPAANAEPRTVDLLSDLDLASGYKIASGTWTRRGDAIVSDLEAATRFSTTYSPPAEYDLTVEFARLAGSDGLDVILCGGGRQFYWTVAGWENTVSGFGTIMGQTVEKNPTMRRRDAWLENGRRYISTIQVRRDGVTALLDGERVSEWKTDYDDMGLLLRHLARPDTIGFSTWESQYAIYSARVTEIAGRGRDVWGTPLDNTPIAFVDFSVAGRPPLTYTLFANGHTNALRGDEMWYLRGDQIVFTWNGGFIDTCTLAPDRRSFSGRNQLGDSIRGVVRNGGL